MSNIKAIRARLGLTQVALAKGLGCTQGNIGHYENKGQTMPPEVARRLIGYAKSLGHEISFDDVYAEPSDSSQAQAEPSQALPVAFFAAGDGWGAAFDGPALTAGLVPEGQGSRPAAELTTDPALNVELARAEQAGLVTLPRPVKPWDGVERRIAQVPRRAADREQDICQAGKGA